MRDVVILGSSGFAKEILWLLEDNNAELCEWNVLGFVDESQTQDQVDGYPILGNDEWLLRYPHPICAVIGIGNPIIRRKVVQRYRTSIDHILFPSILSRHARISKRVELGEGCIITNGSILTTDIILGDFVTVNLDCTVGHDTIIKDFVTINPGVNISGNVTIEENTEIGTGSCIIQGIWIGKNSIVGAGSVIIRDIPGDCTVVGNPGKILRK